MPSVFPGGDFDDWAKLTSISRPSAWLPIRGVIPSIIPMHSASTWGVMESITGMTLVTHRSIDKIFSVAMTTLRMEIASVFLFYLLPKDRRF